MEVKVAVSCLLVENGTCLASFWVVRVPSWGCVLGLGCVLADTSPVEGAIAIDPTGPWDIPSWEGDYLSSEGSFPFLVDSSSGEVESHLRPP